MRITIETTTRYGEGLTKAEASAMLKAEAASWPDLDPERSLADQLDDNWLDGFITVLDTDTDEEIAPSSLI